MTRLYLCRLIAALIASVSICPLARGQASLEGTTLGKSQNDSRDFANSLVPGNPHRPREKTEQVDAKKLPSKTVKDPTFEGNLMDVDLDWTGGKLGKPRTGGNADSNAPKKADAATEKDSKAAKQSDAVGDKGSKVSKSKEAGGVGQNKDQKAAPDAGGDKPSEKERSSAGKPGGDH